MLKNNTLIHLWSRQCQLIFRYEKLHWLHCKVTNCIFCLSNSKKEASKGVNEGMSDEFIATIA